MNMRTSLSTLCLVALTSPLYAGGPARVAGVSSFDPAAQGTPLNWAGGNISYYTDLGDLSAQLPGPSADAFVADAFNRWTSISTAAVSATRAGQLDEDVSGVTVTLNADRTISLPSDVGPGAVSKPVAVVYDADGQVTDALLGSGAGDASSCFTNAVFGGPDNFSSEAQWTHALVVINGNCAQNPAQLPDVKYRLVRVLGKVLGLDWSQANLNPSAQDAGGFPVMHALDPVSCVPISVCYANADVPKMDDRAALSRLYPVTSQNLASFSGKQLFRENTVRVHGSVRFTDTNGQPAQPMQGVNVVARWIDPSNRQVSRTFVASAVAGFLFRGNAGNPITGFGDSLGRPFDRFGSDDTTVEGFFDLGGLEIPDGSSQATYQITVEPVDPLWSEAVGPYAPWQVQPSGVPMPITVTANKGGDVEQDILMRGGKVDTPDWFGPQSFAQPASVPAGGDWAGSLSGYGNTDYFRFAGQANRTLTIEATAVNERSMPAENKALPVIGLGALSDALGSVMLASPGTFNTSLTGMTHLQVSLLTSTDFRIGIADLRGDGRPDFGYNARVFYGDSVIPPRISARGAGLVIRGLGLRSNTKVSFDLTNSPSFGASKGQLLVTAPPMQDGLRSISLSDPVTGANSVMTNALTYGAGPNDTIKLLSAGNPSTPVGGDSPNPIRLQVLDPNGVTPVAGASVFLTSTPAVSFSVCGGATSCTTFSDDSGMVSTIATVRTAGTMTITAQLAPASYSPPKQVQTTLVGTSSALDISLTSGTSYVAQGAPLDLQLSAKVLANGSPVSGHMVDYQIFQGPGTLSAKSAVTNSSGISTTTLHVPSMTSEIDATACVAPQDNPCRTFHLFAVAISSMRLAPVAGALQLVATGQTFKPLTVRVFEVVTGNPVRGANVVFQYVIGRAPDGGSAIQIGDTSITRNPPPNVLASVVTTVQSDVDGLATIQPSTQGIPGALLILGTANAGVASLPFAAQSFGP